MPKKGTTPYVTHFIFRPLESIDVPGVGTATVLEMVGTTENMKGEKMLDKMPARCLALSVDSGGKKYIDGACVMTDSDGDMIFSTFDTRDLDKSQPEMDCGTHIITGGTGKYKGITGREPFACNAMPARRRPAAIRRWTSRTTRPGRSRNRISLPSGGQAACSPDWLAWCHMPAFLRQERYALRLC